MCRGLKRKASSQYIHHYRDGIADEVHNNDFTTADNVASYVDVDSVQHLLPEEAADMEELLDIWVDDFYQALADLVVDAFEEAVRLASEAGRTFLFQAEQRAKETAKQRVRKAEEEAKDEAEKEQMDGVNSTAEERIKEAVRRAEREAEQIGREEIRRAERSAEWVVSASIQQAKETARSLIEEIRRRVEESRKNAELHLSEGENMLGYMGLI